VAYNSNNNINNINNNNNLHNTILKRHTTKKTAKHKDRQTDTEAESDRQTLDDREKGQKGHLFRGIKIADVVIC